MSEILNQSATDTLVFRYTIVATTCFVTYEYLINLDYEIRYLWLRRLTFGSALLFFCRYLPIAQIYVSIVEYVLTSDLRPTHCKSLLKANSALVYLQFCLSNMVLYTRAYAVWSGNKRVLWTLVVTYVLSAVGTAYTVYRYVDGISVLGLKLWSGCIYLVTDHSIFYALIGSALMDSRTSSFLLSSPSHSLSISLGRLLALSFVLLTPKSLPITSTLDLNLRMDAVALCLLLYKSVQHARVMKNIGIRHGTRTKVSLLTVMAQDGMAYFIFNIICTVANIIVLQRASDDYRDFLVTTQSCLQNTLCARLFFHIQTAHKSGSGSTGTITRTLSAAGPAYNDVVEMKARSHRRGPSRNGHRRVGDVDMEADMDKSWDRDSEMGMDKSRSRDRDRDWEMEMQFASRDTATGSREGEVSWTGLTTTYFGDPSIY
ncbi:hypothetical protein SCHPADRAFT_887785 [Schizopora paradoxa]|uniref:DUF6533 domain-containing protein n=1 Tax=Schizopora paradoxa TaxID=27342 RepID=A0A0H2RXG3_9AGAM|nr:hypothetical protein SCHPADRAFT_887785 [Schizopora paradoxa]